MKFKIKKNSPFSALLILILTTLDSTPLQAANVSGAITGFTTWTGANSPYVVTANLTVNNGATLNIEPGVRIELAAGVNFTIANGGTVVAEGNDTNKILFTRVSSNTGRWGGIVVNGGSNSPQSRFAYVHIEFNGTVAIESSGGTLLLDHLTFGSTDHQYLSLDGSSFLISNCYFPTSSAGFELIHGNGGIKAGGRGIVRDSFFGNTTGANDIMDFTGGNRPGQPIIHYFNNVFTGSGDDILDLDGTDAWIQGNIFLHVHKNGSPDSASAVSGGNDGANTSQITIIGNYFFDCDQAGTAKQGNFFTLFNNTIVHTTKTGGTDSASGVVNVRDLDPGPPTTFGLGYYLEGNIIVDTEQLVRNYIEGQTSVTFSNNILPVAWPGPGGGNQIENPLLQHIPQLSETHFTNWESAQVIKDWFRLSAGSPAVGTGPNGVDQGAAVPYGVSISGIPASITTNTSATLFVGINRKGSGIPATGWPNGSGFVAYKWRLDGGAWSSETSIETPISLAELTEGAHYVEVTGKLDSGLYQNDPEFGPDAAITRTPVWTVGGLKISCIVRAGNGILIHFTATAGQTYTVQARDSFDADHPWTKSSDISAQNNTGDFTISIPIAKNDSQFFRLITPSQP
jgi:hypothetical protein